MLPTISAILMSRYRTNGIGRDTLRASLFAATAPPPGPASSPPPQVRPAREACRSRRRRYEKSAWHLKRKDAHPFNIPIPASLLGADDLDFVKRLTAHRTNSRSENIDRAHQVHLPHGRDGEEHDAPGLKNGSHSYLAPFNRDMVMSRSERLNFTRHQDQPRRRARNREAPEKGRPVPRDEGN
jgi:hypothetical protein